MAGEPGGQPIDLFGSLRVSVQVHELKRPPDTGESAGQAGQGAGVGKDAQDRSGTGLGGRAGRTH